MHLVRIGWFICTTVYTSFNKHIVMHVCPIHTRYSVIFIVLSAEFNICFHTAFCYIITPLRCRYKISCSFCRRINEQCTRTYCQSLPSSIHYSIHDTNWVCSYQFGSTWTSQMIYTIAVDLSKIPTYWVNYIAATSQGFNQMLPNKS